MHFQVKFLTILFSIRVSLRSQLVLVSNLDFIFTFRHRETLEDEFVDHKNTVMAKRFDAQRHHPLANGNG